MTTKAGVLALLAMFAAGNAVAAPHGMLYTKQIAEVMHLGQKKASTGPLFYYGGPILDHVKVYAVMWGPNVSTTTSAAVSDYFKAVTNSTAIDFLKQYNTTGIKAQDGRTGSNQTFARGSFGGLFQITPKNTSMTLQDADVQAEIEAQITAGVLPKNDNNSLYMTYFPPGVSIAIGGQASCQAFCAYHDGFTSKNIGNVFYGVMPDLGGACSFGCGFHAGFDNESIISAHEMTEAMTDPFPTPGTTPAYPQAWNSTDGSEIGDLCAFTENNLTTQGQTYLIQGEWDNSTNACTTASYQSP